MKSLMLLTALAVLVFVKCENYCHKDCNGPSEYIDLDQIYEKAKEAYGNHIWHECVDLYEDFLHIKKVREATLNNCQYGCNSRKYELVTPKIEDLQYTEWLIKRGNCLQDCWNKNKIKHPEATFNKDLYEPYRHLHVCYSKIGQNAKAANAAYTCMSEGLQNEQLLDDYANYVTSSGTKEIIDFLQPEFLTHYKVGTVAYSQKDWNGTIVAIESTLTDYFYRDNMCRARCERDFHQTEDSQNFIVFLAQASKILLECKQGCPIRNHLYINDIQFLVDNLNHLQICYYHMENMDDAAAAVASILFLRPSDVDMIENKKIYETLVKEEAFKVRDDIYMYYTRNKHEKYLLNLTPLELEE